MASPQIRVDIPVKLLPLFRPKRYKVLYGGRGSAKSWSVARALVAKAAAEPIRVLCARETQKSIQESVHRLLKDQIELLGLSDRFEVQETKILGRNGSEFVFAGIRQQGVANMKSFEGVDICWVEEAHVVTKRSWDVLIPTIRKPGSEIWVTLNPELDTDETYQRLILDPPSDSWVVSVNYHDNPWFPPELESERLHMQSRDPISYANIWEGQPRAAVEGAIYANEIDRLLRENRFTSVSYDPMLKVHTVWDLGWSDQTVVLLVQRAASEIRIIGAHISQYATYDDDVAALRKLPYRWGKDWMPHDARAKSKAAGGRSPEQIVRALGRQVEIVPGDSVEAGIKYTRDLFPRLWVDKGCDEWMNALKRYRRHISADGKRTGEPVHDDASHGADALRYLALVADRLSNEEWGGQKDLYPTDLAIV
jgi:phage terminase large subunit